MDNVREDLKEKNIRKLPGLVNRPKKQKSLDESCESLIVGTADGREERRREKKTVHFSKQLTAITILHSVSEKTVQNCFCQNFVKFPSILIIFL